MNVEFHYYVTKYLALEAGYDTDEAEIIAYSSQLVNDNYLHLKIKTPQETLYENNVSQIKDITKPEKKNVRIHLLHHYLPGDPTSPKVRRKDGKMHLLITSPASIHAQEIFFDATRNENLYSLGIVAHMLADTFFHQNFVGTFDEMNCMKGPEEELFASLGHADAMYKPDIPNLIWHDPRLIDRYMMVDNTERFLFAANKVYGNLVFMTSFSNKWSKVKKNLAEMLQPTIEEDQLDLVPIQQEQRINKMKALIEPFDCDADYDPLKWLRSAVNEKNDLPDKLDQKAFNNIPLTFKEKYTRSHWYKFQESLKDYQKLAISKLRPILEDLVIPGW